jgi:hypothetical protein
MSDFVESAKNFVNAAVSRTSWEAQKQLRIRSKQSEIDKLLEQRQQLLNEMVQIVMNLHQQGLLTDANLSRLCTSVLELDHDVSNRNAQLQEIRKESYPADQFAPAPTSNYTPPVTPYGSPNSPRMSTPPTPPPAAPPPAPSATAQVVHCPNCGNEVRPGSLYCRSCGAKLR